jgi:putative DNA primase/helicase
MNAEAIAKSLGGYKRNGKNHLCRCPAHEDRSPSLSIADGENGRILVRCFAGCDGAEIIRVLKSRGLLRDSAPQRIEVLQPSTPEHDDRQKIEFALNLWRNRRPFTGSSAQKYVETRIPGLIVREDWPLGFHPTCPFGKERLPAMLALMTDAESNEPCGVHRTALKPDGSGKAEIESPKMMLGRAKNAVVRLSPDDEVSYGLGLVEGIENGLTILSCGWNPVWCALSAGGIRDFPVLQGIECLTIFADHD